MRVSVCLLWLLRVVPPLHLTLIIPARGLRTEFWHAYNIIIGGIYFTVCSHWYLCMQVALQQSATDPNTGTIDMECITTGMTSTDRKAREQLAKELKELLKSKFSSKYALWVRSLQSKCQGLSCP